MGAASTFARGGVHPPERKGTAGAPIVRVAPAEPLVVPLLQHLGSPCEPLVKKGERVLKGQPVGNIEAFIAAPVHSPVAGKVTEVGPRPTATGFRSECVVIEPDGSDEWFDGLERSPSDPDGTETGYLDELEPAAIVARIREAGVVGMGGAAFPTHVKLSPPKGRMIDTVILNGAECEPYLTADHRLMLDRPLAVLHGLAVFMRALGARRGVVAIEQNKPDAIDLLSRLAAGFPGVDIVRLKVRYPQGGEKQLIQAVLGRVVPGGGLPMDVNALVQNVASAAAAWAAVAGRLPLIERVVTLAGSGFARPGNYLAPVGMPLPELFAAAGGLSEGTDRLILGGPMMGRTLHDPGVPVQKSTSGVLAGGNDEFPLETERDCIRCGRCVDACPMGLMPLSLAAAVEFGLSDRLAGLSVGDCIECGSCAYACPARRRLVHYIRLGKQIARRKRS